MAWYQFKESFIFDNSGTPDPTSPTKRIKSRSLRGAFKQLPENSSIGRRWILICEEK